MARIGIDIVEVEQVEVSIATFGDRYVGRVYTARERHDTLDSPRRLAARFAAKEATLKVLSQGDRGVDLRSIEVVSRRDARPMLVLHGAAKEIAHALGLSDFEVSLSHDGDYATAVVLARETRPTRRRPTSLRRRRLERRRETRCR